MSAAAMPPASPPDPHALLEQMLHGDGIERICAWSAGIDAGYGGYTVLDTCNDPDVKFGWTWQQFRRHLFAVDNDQAVRARGYRIHTTRTVELGALEDADAGPALGLARRG